MKLEVKFLGNTKRLSVPAEALSLSLSQLLRVHKLSVFNPHAAPLTAERGEGGSPRH